jgi:plastocyanin
MRPRLRRSLVVVSTWGTAHFGELGGSHNLVGPGVKVGVQSSGSKTVTFKKKGSFKFVCQVHPNMTMTVKVK